MPKVSIIVPIYNVERYLQECLESLVTQALQDIEIICVNDGSTDRSLEILQCYASKDSRIKVINKPNSGYGHTVNAGLETATADYVGIIESDDFAGPEMFLDLYRLITENNCDIAKSQWYEYTGKSGKTVKCGVMTKLKKGQVLNPREEKRLLKMPASIWSGLYRREFLNENGIKFLQTPGASYQDTSFVFKAMACANRVILTDKAYVYYRQDNLDSSVLNKDKVWSICGEYAEIERFLKENLSLDKHFMSIYLKKKYIDYLWNLGRIDEKHRLEFVKYFASEFKIDNPQKFLEKFVWKKKLGALRKNIVSIRISQTQISIELLGRQIVRIG